MAFKDRTVTIIERNPICSKAYSQTFSEAGFLVKTIETGFHGLMDLVDDPPDAIVLGIELPDIDGLHILKNIVQQEDLCWRPLVVVTTQSAPEVHQELLDIGANATINRMTDSPLKLINIILKLLKKHE